MPMLRGALEAFGAIGRLPAGSAAGRRGPGRCRVAPSGRPSPRTALRGASTTRPTRSRGRPPRRHESALPELESLARLAAAGVPVTPVRAVAADDGGEAAVAAWRELGGGPVVLKLDAPGLAHKTEADGVRLGLADEAAVRAAAGELCAVAATAGISIRGLLVEPMAPPGIELIVGGRRDAVFGPAVLVGLGGIFTEVLDDVAVLLAPVTADEVRERLGSLRAAPLLRGVRGRPGVDLDALARIVTAIGDLLVADPSIAEIDCNPVIAGPGGAFAVDALVVVGRA